MLPRLLVVSCLLAGCQVDVTDSAHKVQQEGTSYTYVVVRLEFIEQVRQLCVAKFNELPGGPERDREIANCTLENLQLLNVNFGQLEDFSQQYCQEGADLSGLPADQRAEIERACALLGAL